MGRFLVVGRASTLPRHHNPAEPTFEDLVRTNHRRDDYERRHWNLRDRPSPSAAAAIGRPFIEPAE
ncbi:hypothetical protein [Acuticoccus mangrovi]|uniref:Uncharacterized protein n=1 Tax=Acuticoccus mangrovi TaxID=2796142 RepID=A0A934ISN2_9HYPH|nr:hypothetical protein [Acuticoccus mangrovi]MBJ3777472.1 hypothetical protein [Acuticoccus mangrovi]